MTTVAPVSPVLAGVNDGYAYQVQGLSASPTASASASSTASSNSASSSSSSSSPSPVDETKDTEAHKKGYSSLPIMSRLHHLSALPHIHNKQQSSGSYSAPASPLSISKEDKAYTYEKKTETAPAGPEPSDDDKTACPKLYISGGSPNAKSANFMHRGRRGFPSRVGDDHLSNALMFGHRKSSSSSSDGSAGSPEVFPEKSISVYDLPKLNNSSSSSSDEDGTRIIRKKSGERVKSSLKLPSLVRAKSLPSTSAKNVHFDTKKLVQIRRFSKTDEPNAVSADSSPVEEKVTFHWASDDDNSSSTSSSDDEEEDEYDRKIGYFNYMSSTEWSINLPNFVKHDNDQNAMCYLDHLFLSSDKTTLIGHVAVKNINFHKQVTVRYTVDYWKTVTEVTANYNDDVRKKQQRAGYDRFTFTICLDDLPQRALVTKSMFFCIRYNSNGEEFWDNNHTFNYQIDFNRVDKATSTSRGRRHHHRRNHYRSKSEDFDKHFQTSATRDLVDDEPSPSSPTKNKNKLSARYSFGSSYNNQHDDEVDGIFKFPSSSKKAPSLPLTNAIHQRPAWDSRSYQDLLNNYCFYKEQKPSATTSASKNKTNLNSTTTTATTNNTDTTTNEKTTAITTAASSSEPPFSVYKSPKAGVFV